MGRLARHKRLKSIDPESKRVHPGLLVDLTTSKGVDLAPTASAALPRLPRSLIAMRQLQAKGLARERQHAQQLQQAQEARQAQQQLSLTQKPLAHAHAPAAAGSTSSSAAAAKAECYPFEGMVARPGEKLRAFNSRVRQELRLVRAALRAEATPQQRKASAKRKAWLEKGRRRRGSEDGNGDDAEAGSDGDEALQRSGPSEFAEAE